MKVKFILSLKKEYTALPVQLKASFWFLVCTILQKLVTVVSTPIFSRIMNTSEYGQFDVCISWMNILTCFITMNMYYGIYIQGLVKFNDEKDKFSVGVQGITSFLLVCWLGMYLLFRNNINIILRMSTAQVIAILIIMWGNANFGFWSCEQRVDFKYKKLVIVSFIASILQPMICVCLVLMFSNNKVTARLWGISITGLICYSWMFIRNFRKPQRLFSKDIWKYAIRFSAPLIPHYLSQTVLNSADRIMISKMVGDDTAGIYSLAYTVSMMMTLFNTALLQTVNPWIYKKIKESSHQEIANISYPLLILIAIVDLLLILVSPEVIRIFAPSSFNDAIWVIPPIAQSVYFMFMYNLFSNYEFYYERTSYISVATAICAVTNIVLNFVFIKIFGYIAAGYTTLFCYILFAMMHYLFMRKICKESLNNFRVYDIKKIIIISLLFVVLGFLIMLTYKSTLIRYGVLSLSIILLFLFRKQIVFRVKRMFLLRKEKCSMGYVENNHDLKKLQQVELSILEEFDMVCKKIGINYFLDSGTALGAIRHNGFIPWDDDIDVGMMRTDYNLFLKHAYDYLSKDFFLQTLDTDPACPCLFAKIRKNKTTFMENNKVGMCMHTGIYIDVFPFDYVPTDEMKWSRMLSKIQMYKLLFAIKKIPSMQEKVSSFNTTVKCILRKAAHIVLQIVPDSYFVNGIKNIQIKFCGADREYVAPLFYGKPKRFLTNIFFPTTKKQFEDKWFPVPNDYDYYLRVLYGDYMTLPPKDKQVGHIPFYIDFDKGENK